MLSFPAPRWRTALLATTVSSQSYRGLKLGCASLITPRVYLSDYYTARDTKELSRLGITHVISVIELDPEIPQSIPEKNRLHVPIADRPDVDILGYLGDTTEFIRMALEESEENVVLVHCFQGISRSATVVCAYLVATQRMLAIDSIAFVQSKRGIVCPNNGFRQQLEVYGTRFVGVKYSKQSSRSKIGDGIAGRIRQLKARTSVR